MLAAETFLDAAFSCFLGDRGLLAGEVLGGVDGLVNFLAGTLCFADVAFFAGVDLARAMGFFFGGERVFLTGFLFFSFFAEVVFFAISAPSLDPECCYGVCLCKRPRLSRQHLAWQAKGAADDAKPY
ncbi:MAG TPA: hypothetical protein PLO62_00950 [Candidatus Hydrogenedentes bacterium]|nr:hypothetical protein [Candidatus Hydrogenedentota bacterium]HOS02708.1 hypothetical protein [Candidatus Hydrogenedentota bacterium]